MNDNFTIGSTPIPEGNLCNLKFHQYVIYDSENWTQSGVLRWNATTKNFEVLPDSLPVEKNIINEKVEEEIINNSFLQSKNENNVNSKKIIIPKKNK
jgi:hypothetical protein